MIRYLNKTINLSNYKSYINSKMHAYKDNVVVDISDINAQNKYNATSNHSMLPVTVVINGWSSHDDKDPWHLSWSSLHKLYTFFISDRDEALEDKIERLIVAKNGIKEEEDTEFDYIVDYVSCFHKILDIDLFSAKEMANYILQNIAFLSNVTTNDIFDCNNKEELIELLKGIHSVLDISVWDFIQLDTFKEIKKCIKSFVEEGESINGCVQYEQDIKNMNPCEGSFTVFSNFEIPIMITNSIDNLGQVTNLIDEWKPYNDDNIITEYNNDDWIKNKEYKGYEWDNDYKECYFDESKWLRSIDVFNEKKLVTLKPSIISSIPNEVKGEVSSQLSLFKNKNLFYDELGSSVDAEFIVPSNKLNEYTGILRPNNGDPLSLQYKVGTVNNLTKINIDLYWGNILHSIKFQVRLGDIRIDDSELLTIDFTQPTGFILKEIYSNFTIEYNEDYKLVVINKDKSKLEQPLSFQDALDTVGCRLICEISYNIGGFIKKNSDDNFVVADDEYHGIQYTDYLIVEQKTFMYNKSLNERYLIYYYTLEGEYFVNDFKSHISMDIPMQYECKNNLSTKDALLYTTDNENNKFDVYKGFMYSPTIREDFYIGTTSQEKVSGNIYIDRGVSSAFENYFKMQEVTTMQDLENYSNGGFFNVTSMG